MITPILWLQPNAKSTLLARDVGLHVLLIKAAWAGGLQIRGLTAQLLLAKAGDGLLS